MLRRHLVCLLTSIGLLILYGLRSNLSIAVVTMTTLHPVMLDNGTVVQVRDFDWTSEQKGLILSSFFYGYTLAEIPSSWLTVRYGGATIFGIEMMLTAVFTVLLPVVAYYGPYAILVFRALTGIFESGSMSCMQHIWSRWAPEKERGRLVALSVTGISLSYIVCYPVYGLLSTYCGWKSLFYVPAAVALLWSVVWFINVTDDPSDDTRITAEELRYIQITVGQKSTTNIKYQWSKLATSIPVWACIITHFCQSWGYFLFSMELPSYLNDVWKMSTQEAGLWLILPHIPVIIVTALNGIIDSYLINELKISTTMTRKLFQLVSGIGCASWMAMLAFSSTPIMSILFITMFNGFYAFYYGSVYANPLDLAPKYASLIMGIVNTAGCASAILSPLITGYIVVDQTRSQWTIVFLICSIIYIVGTVVYSVFGSAKLQSWASNTEQMHIVVSK